MPRPTARGPGRLLVPALLGLATLSTSGCAVRLVAPAPDAAATGPTRVAERSSHVALVARLPLTRVGALLDALTVEPVELGQRVRFAGWKLRVRRAGEVKVRAENGRLCVAMPFEGLGRIEVVGRAVDRHIRAVLEACAEPRLERGAVLKLRRPTARVQVGRRTVGGMTRVLYEALEHHLRAAVSPRLLEAATSVRIPLSEALAPLWTALGRPHPLPGGACLKLRPERVRVGQPDVDPTQLRMSASLTARPTIERPCTPARPGPAPALEIADELPHPETDLLLPVGIALSGLRGPLLEALRGAGRIAHQGGWLRVTGLRLYTSGGAVVARATVRGQTRGGFAGFGWTRDVRGEVNLWGVPELTKTHVGLADVQVLVEADGAVTDLVASLQRSRIRQVVAERLRWPRADLRARASKLIHGLTAPLKVGSERLPVSVDTRTLRLDSVRARHGRLDVRVRFRGQIVVGSTRRL